jgi:hypothetical protein
VSKMCPDSSQDSQNSEKTTKKHESQSDKEKKAKRDLEWERFEMSFWHETRPQS